jgi:membrane associated rhomboid family serine protease
METGDRRTAQRDGLLLVAALAALMWLVEVVDQVLGGRLDRYGIEPHNVDGLAGIVSAPFLHAGWGHLIGNTIPFLALGAVIALSGVARVAAVTAIVAVVGGLGTWLVAPAGTDHIGASGIVFGYASYLIARGAFSRRPVHLLAGVVVLAIYGATLLVSLVPADGISWQGHLFGAVGGLAAARALDASRRAPAVAGAPRLS